jgi:hypothetical protein
MGHGAIGYPTEFHDASEFECLTDSPSDPLSIEYCWVYPPVQGVFDPNAAKWITFLYRGRQSALPLCD